MGALDQSVWSDCLTIPTFQCKDAKHDHFGACYRTNGNMWSCWAEWMTFNDEIVGFEERRDAECQQMSLNDEIVCFEEKSDSECQQMTFNGEIVGYECQQMILNDEIVGFEERSESECQQMTLNDEIVGFEGASRTRTTAQLCQLLRCLIVSSLMNTWVTFNEEIAGFEGKSDSEGQQMSLNNEIVCFEEKSDSACQQMRPSMVRSRWLRGEGATLSLSR